ncbi:transposable element Tcb1 transposase [Trichonephila clavipes]|nr:transposable element Tcb1 transposase [Trichonephila clavipes]
MCSLTATHCRLRLTWSGEHALWTPQQWSFVMFSDESGLFLLSDSRLTLIWRVPCTYYTRRTPLNDTVTVIAGWLVLGEINLGSRTAPHVSNCNDDRPHLSGDVILEQCLVCFRGAMGAEFLLLDDNARPHRANIVDEFLQLGDITLMHWTAYSPA